MARLCKVPDCKYPRHSHRYCEQHQYLREDEDWVKKQAQKEEKRKARIAKAIEKQKESRRRRPRLNPMSPAKQKELAEQHKLDKALYMEIWDERPAVCFYCGIFLGSEPMTTMFHHELEKSKYPELRLEKEGIDLVCFQCHSECHSANPTEKMIQRKVDLIKYFKEKGLI